MNSSAVDATSIPTPERARAISLAKKLLSVADSTPEQIARVAAFVELQAGESKRGWSAAKSLQAQVDILSSVVTDIATSDYEQTSSTIEEDMALIEGFIASAQGGLRQLQVLKASASMAQTPDSHLPATVAAVDNTTLCHAAYLWAGFEGMGPGSKHEALLIHGGQIGAAIYVTEFANVLAKAVCEADRLGFDYPDVFDYQVTSAMGAWLRQNPTATEEGFCVALLPRLQVFFERDCQAIAEVLLPTAQNLEVVAVRVSAARDDSPSP